MFNATLEAQDPCLVLLDTIPSGTPNSYPLFVEQETMILVEGPSNTAVFPEGSPTSTCGSSMWLRSHTQNRKMNRRTEHKHLYY